ncbi:hypothetical protein DL89DRAFT_125517 [Linderina pennispora]|uniref:Ras-GAP domain-containing protein n=1 Tax=Linderina pennispora TaxID=61395 RepID=A0A1Y1WE45_9FUNG|nr:uncharacterized protein DL89DRAFT_125517 [Linderina pennispora]ORX71454.1 hypothetical protein DL89DRAFT_125517 [Linderina pennispora]
MWRSCELDLLRLPPGTTTDTLDCNAFNLYTVCRSVLDAVFVAVKYAPPEMRRMCAFIRHEIESQWDPPVATAARHDSMLNSYVLKPASPDSPGKMKMQLQPYAGACASGRPTLKSTVQTDIMSDISAALEERLEEPKSVSDKYEMFEKAVLGLALTDESSRESAASSKRCSSIFTESPAERTEIDTRKSIQDLVTSSFAELNRLDTTFPMNTKTKAQDIKSKKAKRAKKHLSKRFSGSYFSPVETVISMLLFVRFFIPILTAPDTYDIDIELSPAHRRGLLLCAKVMAVLCNGMSFGSKEPCLSPMNGLIREYRPKTAQVPALYFVDFRCIHHCPARRRRTHV